jgi:hypothetical protein
VSGSLAGVLSSARRLSAQDRGCFFGGEGGKSHHLRRAGHNGVNSPHKDHWVPYSLHGDTLWQLEPQTVRACQVQAKERQQEP